MSCVTVELRQVESVPELAGDWCLSGMGESVAEAMRRDLSLGRTPYEIELAPGVLVNVAPTGERALERLSNIDAISEWLASEHGMDRQMIRATLLRVDGWVLARGRLLSPLWMRRGAEVTFARLRKMDGYEWIADVGDAQ